MIYQRTIQITSSMVDFKTEIHPFSIVQMFEDSMTNLFRMIGIDGITVKEKYNAMWLVTKTQVTVFKMVHWGEWCDIDCYLVHKTAVTAIVEMTIKDKLGNLLLVGHMELCPFSIEHQRVLRVFAVGLTQEETLYPAVLDFTFLKFDEEVGIVVDSVVVRSCNLDMSIHTNNKEYVRFAMGSYSYDELKEKQIKSFEVHYIGQSFEKDHLTINRKENDVNHLITIQRDGSCVFQMNVEFE